MSDAIRIARKVAAGGGGGDGGVGGWVGGWGEEREDRESEK
jgi:hypothetical protein